MLPVGSASTPVPNRRRPALPLPELAMFDHGALPVGPPLDVRPEAPEEREPPGVHHTVRGTHRTPEAGTAVTPRGKLPCAFGMYGRTVKQAGPLGRQARSCRPVRQAAYRSGRQDRTAGPDGRLSCQAGPLGSPVGSPVLSAF